MTRTHDHPEPFDRARLLCAQLDATRYDSAGNETTTREALAPCAIAYGLLAVADALRSTVYVANANAI